MEANATEQGLGEQSLVPGAWESAWGSICILTRPTHVCLAKPSCCLSKTRVPGPQTDPSMQDGFPSPVGTITGTDEGHYRMDGLQSLNYLGALFQPLI